MNFSKINLNPSSTIYIFYPLSYYLLFILWFIFLESTYFIFINLHLHFYLIFYLFCLLAYSLPTSLCPRKLYILVGVVPCHCKSCTFLFGVVACHCKQIVRVPCGGVKNFNNKKVQATNSVLTSYRGPTLYLELTGTSEIELLFKEIKLLLFNSTLKAFFIFFFLNDIPKF